MRDNNFEQEKIAMNITVTPGAVIGALTGTAIASRKKKKNFQEEMAEIRQSRPFIEKRPKIVGNYYAQVDAVAKNLRVIFTPLSVIYIVRNNMKDIPIETINTSAMDNVMYDAWKNKNEDFFKRMLLNKMMMEISFAEKMFAKDIITNHDLIKKDVLSRNGKIVKEASCDSEVLSYIEKTAEIKNIYEGLSKTSAEKLASLLYDAVDDSKNVEISWGFDGNAEKYASLGNATDVFGANFSADRIKNVKKKLESPKYLRENVDIGFLPDRVAYIVNNVVIATFPVLNMDKQSFEAFKLHDSVYFNRKFYKELVKGNKAFAKAASEEAEEFKKEAAAKLISAPKATIFRMGGISPYIYYEVLKRKYSYKWNEIDTAALIKMIEVDFNLNESGIADIPLNKILSISACLSEETVNAFTNTLAFEKIVRSFNDLPVDFLASEKDTISVNEMVYGIVCYAEIMYERGKDVYELFSDEVKDYIAEFLYEKNIAALYPAVSESASAMEFYGDINNLLLRLIIERNNLTSEDMDSKEYKEATQNEILQPITIDILTQIREKSISEDITSEFIEDIAKKYEFDLNKEALLRRQIKINLDVDEYVSKKIEMTEAQVNLYNLA